MHNVVDRNFFVLINCDISLFVGLLAGEAEMEDQNLVVSIGHKGKRFGCEDPGHIQHCHFCAVFIAMEGINSLIEGDSQPS